MLLEGQLFYMERSSVEKNMINKCGFFINTLETKSHTNMLFISLERYILLLFFASS